MRKRNVLALFFVTCVYNFTFSLNHLIDKMTTWQNGRLMSATQYVSPNYCAREKGEKIHLIVLHNISLAPFTYGSDAVMQLFAFGRCGGNGCRFDGSGRVFRILRCGLLCACVDHQRKHQNRGKYRNRPFHSVTPFQNCSAHFFSSSAAAEGENLRPSSTLAPFASACILAAESPMPLPPEVQNGTTVFPVRS